MKKLKRLIEVLKVKDHDLSTPEGRANERSRRIALTAATSMVAKVAAMAIPLVSVRVSYRYLGEEIYGLWSTVTSFFALFAFADLGLGSGLQTSLSRSEGAGDRDYSRSLISSAFVMLSAVALIIMAVFSVAFPFVNWKSLLNIESEQASAIAGGVVFAIVLSKVLNIPLALTTRTQNALQEGYRSYVWQTVGSILSITAVFLVARLDLGAQTLIWASSMASIVIIALNFIVYFQLQRREFRPKVKFVKLDVGSALFRVGISFLVLSVLTSIGLSLDNFIVARTIGLKEVASFSVLKRTSHLVSVGCTMLSTPLWGAFGEAMAKGDTKWVKKMARKMSLISTFISVSAIVFFLTLGRFVFRIWIGPNFEYETLVLLGLFVMQFLLSFIAPYFMVLNAAGIVKKQILLFSVYTAVSFALKYGLGLKYGAVAVAWMGPLCYAVFIVPWVYSIAKRSLDKISKIQAEQIE